MKYIVSMLVLITSVFGLTAEMHETYRVAPGAELNIDNINGKIDITRIDGDDIIIDIVKRTKKDQTELEKATIDITSGKTISIITKYLEDDVDVAVDISLQVPDNIMGVFIDNVNGSIDVEGIHAKLNIESANGDVTVIETQGTVEIQLANGDVRVEGNAVIEDIDLANGSIIAEVRSVSEDGVQFDLANGTIKVYILEDLDANIEANIVLGDLEVHGLDIDYTEQTKSSFEGLLNDGGPLIEMGASTGNIRIYGLKD